MSADIKDSQLELAASVAIQERLRLLETIVGTEAARPPLCVQTTKLFDAFNRLLKESPAISHFLQLYEHNAALLAADSEDDLPSLSTADKRELVLSAADEIVFLERTLREIKNLDDNGVLANGNLADYQTLGDELKSVQETFVAQTREFAAAERRVIDHLSAYNMRVDKLSEIFVLLNRQMSSIENGISRLEREQEEVY